MSNTPSPNEVARQSGQSDVPRIVFVVLVIALLIGGTLWIIKPFLPALVWSTMIVVATWPLMRMLQNRLGGRRWAAVLVMTLALATLVIVPIGLAVGTIAEHVLDLKDEAANLLSHPLPPPPDWLGKTPMVGPRLVSEWQAQAAEGPTAMVAKLQPYAGKVAAWIAARAGSIGMLSLHLLLTIALAAVLYANGEQAANGVRRFARRMGGKYGDNAVVLAGQAIRAVAMGIVVTALVQSGLGGIAIAIAGVPYVAVLTSIMFICCIAQIGPGLVLIGSIIWLFHGGNNGMGTFLLIAGLIVTSLDNILRPLLIKRGADVPLLLILTGVMGGLVAFGIVGLFVGPVVLAVSYTLVNAWIDSPGAMVDPAIEPEPDPYRSA